MQRKNKLLKKQSIIQNGNKVVTFGALGVVLLLMIVGTVRIMQGAQAASAGPSAWPPAKATMLAQEEQQMAQARAHPHPKPSYTPPLPQTPTVRQAGIIDTHQGPFPAAQFTVRNFWQGLVGKDWELVYAGAKVNSDGSMGPGALVLYNETINHLGGFDLKVIGTYPAPNATTALTITAVNGNIMQLSTDTGNVLIFNLQTDQYN